MSVRGRFALFVLVALIALGMPRPASAIPGVHQVSINDVTASEGNSGTKTFSFSVSVTPSANAVTPVTVQWIVKGNDGVVAGAASTNNRTATAGEDFLGGSGTLTFSDPAVTSQTVSVTVLGDGHIEPDETFEVVISSSDATVAKDKGVGTIVNDDAGQPYRLSVSDPSVAEGDSGEVDLVYTVTQTGGTPTAPPNPQAVTFDFVTSDGPAPSADDASDYDARSGRAEIPAGGTSTTVVVKVNGDTLYELDEKVRLTIDAASNAVAAKPSGDGTIVNDDDEPVLTVADKTVTEPGSDTTTNFVATLGQASSQDVVLSWKTTAGTATAGADYTEVTNGTATISAGQTTANLPVQIKADNLDEANETFTVDVVQLTGATCGDCTALGTIQDDTDAAVTVSVADVTVGEGAGKATFQITLSAASGQPVTVDYATADGTATAPADYSSTSGAVTFDPGQTTKPIDVPINQDTLDEADGDTFQFTVTPATGTPATCGDCTATGTITDDDALPLITVSNAQATEADPPDTDPTMTFTISLSAASGRPVTVSYSTSDGTAVAPSDYTAIAATPVTFAPGQTEKTVTVTVRNDNANEGNETFTLNVTDPATADCADCSGTGTIVDDEASVAVTVDDVGAAEVDSPSSSSLVFSVRLSQASANDVDVTYRLDNGSAKSGEDYGAGSPASPLRITAGNTTGTITVPITADLLAEPTEYLTLVLTGATFATITDPEATGTINDDDGTPASLSIGNATVTEGNTGSTNANFTVTLSQAQTRNVTVFYEARERDPAEATKGADFTAVSGELTIAAGQTTGTIAVPVVGDTIDEIDERFEVFLHDAGNASISDSVGDGTIDDNDGPALSISDATSVVEGHTGTKSMTFTVTISGASPQAVSASFATADGTATQPSDYTSNSGTVTFPAGTTTPQTITVTIKGDTTDEADEALTVTLSAPQDGTLADSSGTGTIVDDDGPVVSIDDATAVAEGDSGTTTMTFVVRLSAPSPQDVTVPFSTSNGTATSPSDFEARSGQVTFAGGSGSTTQNVTVSVKGDTIAEPDETLLVELGTPTNATLGDATASGTITNDDPERLVSVADVTLDPEGNSGSTDLIFTVSVSPTSPAPIEVAYATSDGSAVAPGDYTSTSGTATIPANAGSTTVAVPVTGDATDELDETFTFTITPPTGSACADDDCQATGTIADDDPSPSLSIADASVTEGNTGTTNATFAVTLSAASGREVTVKYATADGTAGSADYTATAGTLTFPAGTTTRTVTVPVKGDTVDEDNETFTVTLSEASAAAIADGSATGTITDDDETSAPANDQGYVLVGQDGAVYPFGTAQNKGDMRGQRLNAPIIGAAYAPGGGGYWLVAKDGGIFTFGTAEFYGSMGGTKINSDVLGMQPTPTGRGYWLFAGDGGIFSFGDAEFFGSMGAQKLNSPVVQMEPLASGKGYWLVAGDGGIFSFGSAEFWGSTGNMRINQPVFDMTSTDSDKGYWLVARDGGVFSFGDAERKFYGSAVGQATASVIGMDSTPTSLGYWIADANGRVLPYGDARSLGDRYAAVNPAPMVAFASVPPAK